MVARAADPDPTRRRGQVLFAAFASGVVLALAGGLLAAAPAVAKPRYPSQDDVQRARRAVDATASQVQQLQTALAGATARLTAARVSAEQAAEAYDAAQIELARRTQAASLAAAAADRAEAATERARRAVGQLAAQDYRDGRPNLLDVLFSSQTPQDLMARTATLGMLANERVQTLRQFDLARTDAALARQQADDLLGQQRAATTALATAQRTAAQAADAALALVAQTRTQQQQLVAQLAALRHTSESLERQRQAGLLADAAEAAAQRRARRPSPPGGGSPFGDLPRPPSGSRGAVAVAWAQRQVGLPYAWGGAGPDSYDCSGLTMRAWQQAGVHLPHYAASQYAVSERVAYAAMRPGDLIFYATDTAVPATIHHVAMYVGGGMMVEAPFTGATIRIVPVRWNQAMPSAGRP